MAITVTMATIGETEKINSGYDYQITWRIVNDNNIEKGDFSLKRLKFILLTAILAFTMVMPSFAFAAVDSPAKNPTYTVVVKGANSKTYNGKSAKVQVYVITDDGNGNIKTEVKTITTPVNAGKYKYTFNGKSVYYTIKQAKNVVSVTKNKTYTKKQLKKKGKSFQIKTKSKNKGKVTYKSSSKYVKVSKKGKVTISKKAKKGTYKIKVTVAAKGNYGKCVKYIKIREK